MSPRRRPRPPRALGDQHLPVVLAVIEANPGKGLWPLTPVIARKVGRPTLSYLALRGFLVDRGIEPPQPVRKGVKPSRKTGGSPVNGVIPLRPPRRGPVTAGGQPSPSRPSPHVVSSEHVAAATVYNSVFAFAGGSPLSSDVRASESSQMALARRRVVELRAEAVVDAQKQTSDWLSAADVGRAARVALAAALKAWKVVPDDDEFDPDRPHDWFQADMFAEQVADLFRLAVFDLARRFGVPEAAHECSQLSGLSGAAEVLKAMKA